MKNETEEKNVDILLVEDNPRDAELTMRALKKRNLANHVVWVKDGAEALDYLFGAGTGVPPACTHTPKVILLDLKLPKVDGLEVLRRLKGEDRTKVIPVVVLTSSREEQDIVESYRLGVNSQYMPSCATASEKFSNSTGLTMKLFTPRW